MLYNGLSLDEHQFSPNIIISLYRMSPTLVTLAPNIPQRRLASASHQWIVKTGLQRSALVVRFRPEARNQSQSASERDARASRRARIF